MESQIINVGLYGGKSIFGGRETPQRAELIYCDKFEQCSYYKNHQCFCVTVPFGKSCKYGRVNVAHGYTSRAQKYYEFDSRYRKHEKYHNLTYPPEKLGLVGNEIVFPYPFIQITVFENEVRIEYPRLGANVAYIPLNLFTVELINRICTFRPNAMFGGEIKDFQFETVPLFLAHLKEVMPEKYAEYAEKYGIKEINYVGRKALLKTINPSEVLYKNSQYSQFNENWYWDGEVLTRKGGYVSDFRVTKNYEVLEIKIKPSEKSVITVSSNEQVNDSTVFID